MNKTEVQRLAVKLVNAVFYFDEVNDGATFSQVVRIANKLGVDFMNFGSFAKAIPLEGWADED